MCKSVFRNIIPTINLDGICSTAQKVLPYAPDYPVGRNFSTHPICTNLIDRILSEIGITLRMGWVPCGLP